MELRGTGVGRRIQLAVGTGFALVLLVGGASVFLAWSRSRGRRARATPEGQVAMTEGLVAAVLDKPIRLGRLDDAVIAALSRPRVP